jgi:hypothetical protein
LKAFQRMTQELSKYRNNSKLQVISNNINNLTSVEFEVSTSVTVEFTVFCDVTPCSLVVVYGCEERIASIFRIEETSYSKSCSCLDPKYGVSTFENFYQITRRHIPEDNILRTDVVPTSQKAHYVSFRKTCFSVYS